jgi:hypothetical protein
MQVCVLAAQCARPQHKRTIDRHHRLSVAVVVQLHARARGKTELRSFAASQPSSSSSGSVCLSLLRVRDMPVDARAH